jgi:hypothetical protein
LIDLSDKNISLVFFVLHFEYAEWRGEKRIWETCEAEKETRKAKCLKVEVFVDEFIRYDDFNELLLK